MTPNMHISRAVAHWSSARESKSLKERQEGLRKAAIAGRMGQAIVQGAHRTNNLAVICKNKK